MDAVIIEERGRKERRGEEPSPRTNTLFSLDVENQESKEGLT